MVHSAWEEKGGLARELMGPEKVIRLGRKAGEVVWKGMIGGKEGLKMMHVCQSVDAKAFSVLWRRGTLRPPVAFPMSRFFNCPKSWFSQSGFSRLT